MNFSPVAFSISGNVSSYYTNFEFEILGILYISYIFYIPLINIEYIKYMFIGVEKGDDYTYILHYMMNY